jgi:hypothetical protein
MIPNKAASTASRMLMGEALPHQVYREMLYPSSNHAHPTPPPLPFIPVVLSMLAVTICSPSPEVLSSTLALRR